MENSFLSKEKIMLTRLPTSGRSRTKMFERSLIPTGGESSPAARSAITNPRVFHAREAIVSPTQSAPREMVGQAEIQLEDRTTFARTLYVSDGMLEVYSKSRMPVRAEIQARVMGAAEDWSHGVVSKCVETIGGWKVEMLFDRTAPGGSC